MPRESWQVSATVGCGGCDRGEAGMGVARHIVGGLAVCAMAAFVIAQQKSDPPTTAAKAAAPATAALPAICMPAPQTLPWSYDLKDETKAPAAIIEQANSVIRRWNAFKSKPGTAPMPF